MTITYDDFRTRSVTYTERWGHRFWLYPIVDREIYNILNRDGEYLATVQRSAAGWRYYSDVARFQSTKPRKSRTDAFHACVGSSYIKRRFNR